MRAIRSIYADMHDDACATYEFFNAGKDSAIFEGTRQKGGAT